MTGDVTFVIMCRPDRSVSGGDTSILGCPPEWLVDGQVVVLPQHAASLRELFEEQAVDLGDQLHHADVWFTTDPVVVEARGNMHPSCEHCQAAVRAALRRLREEPDRPLIVAQLWWCGP